MMNDLKEQGFEAINAAQMADFHRSQREDPYALRLLIQDDRHTRRKLQRTLSGLIMMKWGWPVVNSLDQLGRRTPRPKPAR